MSLERLLRKRQKVLRGIKISPRLIKASPVMLARACGRPNCRCLKGQKHVSLYISQSYKARTKMTYIPHRYEEAVTESVERSKQLLKALGELTELNLEIIRKRGKI